MRELRAPRYNKNPDLAFAIPKLHCLDFEAAMAWYEGFKPACNEEIAFLACNDRFYLLMSVLKRKDICHPWLYDRCREVEARPDGYLDLWSRFHYKSSIITFAGVIQEVLINPDLTVAIFSHTKPIAHAFLAQIKREFEENATLHKVFHDVVYDNPTVDSPKWSLDGGIILKRTSNPREATIEAHGLVDGQPISRHYDLLVYDDVVVERSVTTPDQIIKTTRMWELSDNLSTHLGARKWHAGTRYCTIGTSRVLMGDWSHKSISDVRIGDTVVGWELRDGKRYLRPAKVVNRGVHAAQPVNKYTFSSGRSVTCTDDHKWWRGPWGTGAEYQPLALPRSREGRSNRICQPRGTMPVIRELLVPIGQDDGRDASWMAGFFDGEGTIRKNTHHPSGVVCITQTMHNPGLIDEVRKVLSRLDFKFSEHWASPSKGAVAASKPARNQALWKDRCVFSINGGWRERYRFLAQVAPVRRDKLTATLFGQLTTSKHDLVSVEGAGSADVHWLETETGNYVIEGFCSSNSFGDTYGIIIERKALRERRYPATDDGTLKGNPVFLTTKRWAEIKTSQRSTVSAQMLLNPVAGNDAIFLSEWFTSYEVYPTMMNVYIMVDPSKGKRNNSRGGATTSDRTAIAVVGIDQGGNKYLLDGYCHRMRLSQRYAFIKDLHKKWTTFPGVQVVKVGYEQYGQQVDLEVIEEYQARDRVYFELEELAFPREGMHSKKHRVERLEPDMKTGRFLMPALVHHPDVVPIDDNAPIPDALRSAGITRGTCVWSVWTQGDADKAAAAGTPSKHQIGQIINRPLRALTNRQRFCERTMQHYRIVYPLRRLDEDGNIYDLTRVLMEEARFFPFAPHDDLIDAVSRIYDLEPAMPVIHESTATDAPAEDDIGIPTGG